MSDNTESSYREPCDISVPSSQTICSDCGKNHGGATGCFHSDVEPSAETCDCECHHALPFGSYGCSCCVKPSLKAGDSNSENFSAESPAFSEETLKRVREIEEILLNAPRKNLSEKQLDSNIRIFCKLANIFPQIAHSYEQMYEDINNLRNQNRLLQDSNVALLKENEELKKENLIYMKGMASAGASATKEAEKKREALKDFIAIRDKKTISELSHYNA